MEHEIIIQVKRYVPGNLLDSQPNEIVLYDSTKQIEDADFMALDDILEQARIQVGSAILEDVEQNCQHEQMIEDELENCPVCGINRTEATQTAQEDLVDMVRKGE